MSNKLNKGFVQGSSRNLPSVYLDMLCDFISNNDLYKSAEMQGKKLIRSMREGYGDNAVGWVQVQRLENSTFCTVECKICPEHKNRSKDYCVKVVVDETKDSESVVSAECVSCTASEGGCKHAVAFLAWLYRKSQDPSPTSTDCYWKKPLLSRAGSDIKYKEIDQIVKRKKEDKMILTEKQINFKFLQSILNHPKAAECESHLIQFFSPQLSQKVSMHYFTAYYNGDKNNAQAFRSFCEKAMPFNHLLQVQKLTRDQSKSNLWFELRYGRITASLIYDASRCKTPEGSLVEKIMGKKNLDTSSMQRGRNLENLVLSAVTKILKKDYNVNAVHHTGLILDSSYPIFGASPDGMTTDAVIEIKCPTNQKTAENYYNNGQIKNKYKAQIQLQMLFAALNKGYFCVASPDFETSKKVNIYIEHLDIRFIGSVIQEAMQFWDKNIFPLLMKTKL